jgi:hypothetical protein
MRKTFIKTVLLALGAVALFASCEPKEPVKKDVLVSISASSDKFTDGKVTLNLALSDKSSSDVTATLDASGSIPAAALSFEKSVSIAAGSTSASVPVTLDASALKAGSYETTFTLVSANGAKVDDTKKDCKVSITVEEKEPEPEPDPIPVVSISASDDEFTDNVATFTLALDVAGKTDISVDFAVGAVEGYTAIPAEAMSFENPAVIPAGTTSKVVTITLDPSQLAVGENWAMISIASVSEKATVGDKKSFYVMATAELKAQEVPEWKLSYAGREAATNGNVYDWVQVEGWTGEFYGVVLYDDGILDDPTVNGDVTVLMKEYEEEVVYYNNYYPLDQILRNQATYTNFKLLDPGTYDVFLFDFTSSAKVTGKYAKAKIVIEEEEASDDYKALLGIYNVTNAEGTLESIYVDTDVNNMSYTVYFPVWDEDDKQNYYYPSIFEWNRSTGAISASTKLLDEWEHSSYGRVEDWQYGCISMNSQYYYVTGNYTILQSEGFKDGSFVAQPGPELNLSGGSTYPIAGLQLVGSLLDYKDAQGQGGYAFTYFRLLLPATFTRVADLPADEQESESSVSFSGMLWNGVNSGHATRGFGAKTSVKASRPIVPAVKLGR